MKCKICNKRIINHITFSDFFSNKKRFICDECYKLYPLHINYTVIPLSNYELKIYSMFEKEYYFKNDPFNLETAQILTYLLEKYADSIILLEKKLFLNETNLSIYEVIADINKKDLCIICESFSF